jgi:hypothetical protein
MEKEPTCGSEEAFRCVLATLTDKVRSCLSHRGGLMW